MSLSQAWVPCTPAVSELFNRIHEVTQESKDTGIAGGPRYGDCDTSIYVDSGGQNVELYKYRCTIQPVPSRVITRTCPDCPTRMDLNDTKVSEAANLSLKEFNKISSLSNYFALLSLTGASM
ncbi:hypothetical protein AGOR_G00145180 [Albula goreensis]|uniref:Uncharacterized protein n=1 Tax=Albula goreensis TaxID=1534307 RepID=A0A8T3D1R5_9TELE|nr:hypothetical protein AGOR_G00145180 [Albula goreensis]